MQIDIMTYLNKENKTNKVDEEKEYKAIDELGTGDIRDIYSDILFPGMSSIQTRAKYFVLIPYILQYIVKSDMDIKTSKDVIKAIEDLEDKMVKVLEKNSGKHQGIIGVNALKQGKTVKIKPYKIYWSGLRTLGLLKHEKISINTVCKVILNYKEKIKNQNIFIKDNNLLESKNFLVKEILLDEIYDENFLENSNIELTKIEAEYLFNKISTSKRLERTCFRYLLENGDIAEEFEDISTNNMTEQLKKDYVSARDFSNLIYGAYIWYKYLVSNKKDESTLEEFEKWTKNFDKIKNIDLNQVFSRTKGKGKTKRFCEKFKKIVEEYIEGKDNIKELDKLITERELEVKGSNAKIYNLEFEENKKIYKYIYRYDAVKDIIEDILEVVTK